MLTIQPISGMPLVSQGDDLGMIITDLCRKSAIHVAEGDIFVLAQKIVSKSEGRLVNLTQIDASPAAIQLAQETGKDPRFVELVLRESKSVLRKRAGVLIVEHNLGFICANAGIDHSNVKGSWGDPADWVLLLPENPDRSADTIRRRLQALFGFRLGVLVIDSHGRAWRMGTVGVAIGISGIPGLVDLRGKEDLFGYRLQITQVAAADELAAAASLMMGQAAEASPVVHVRGFPYPLRESALGELIRPLDEDLFR
ncbi:MAG: coenzyme F420-0:L-glutamate ligase [Anaerolineaceae bacterium]|nr:coenzyme F420-0:L-glutamate ligase [Anaerolineaceae bacterium]